MKHSTASSTAPLTAWSPHNRALASVLLKAGTRGLTVPQMKARMIGAQWPIVPRLQQWESQGLVMWRAPQGRIVWYATDELKRVTRDLV